MEHQDALEIVMAATELVVSFDRFQRAAMEEFDVSVTRATLQTSWGFGFVSGEGSNLNDKVRAASAAFRPAPARRACMRERSP